MSSSQIHPTRMIVRGGGFQDGWSLATQEEKNAVFSKWAAAHRAWLDHGCTLIATLDDEFNCVGQPRARLWNFYSIWEIDETTSTYELLNYFRDEQDDLRLDKYFSLEIVTGKPIGGLERAINANPDQEDQQ